MRNLLNASFVALLTIALAACSSTTENTDNTDNTDNTGDTTTVTPIRPIRPTPPTLYKTLPPKSQRVAATSRWPTTQTATEKDRDALIVFNANGDWVHYEIQDVNGNATFVMQYEYDENHNLLQRTNRNEAVTLGTRKTTPTTKMVSQTATTKMLMATASSRKAGPPSTIPTVSARHGTGQRRRRHGRLRR